MILTSFLDKLLSNFRWYRKLRGGHWERLQLEFLSSNATRPSPWICKSKCYGEEKEADDMICIIALECEENGKGVDAKGNDRRWRDHGSFEITTMPR
jgi:hypothetical protein